VKRDVQATEAALFFERGSYIAKDGREVLCGLDWRERKNQLQSRCNGWCERCHKADAVHPHHVVKRSVARDDRLGNLLAVCESCHRALHPEKQLMSARSNRDQLDR
jgi:hypothetical protein